MSFTSHGKENTCLAAKTGTILHKKCFTIFSIVAHSDEYLHTLLNIYLFIIYLNIYLFIIYLNNYLFISFIYLIYVGGGDSEVVEVYINVRII